MPSGLARRLPTMLLLSARTGVHVCFFLLAPDDLHVWTVHFIVALEMNM